MNEQPPKFPEKAEIDKAIDNWVEKLLQWKDFFENNKEEKIKTIFSTEIREHQSQNNNSSQSLKIEKLTQIVKKVLKDKTMAFLSKIKQQEQCKGNEFVIDDTWPNDVVLTTNDGKQRIMLLSSIHGLYNNKDGLHTYKPPITPIIKSVSGNKYNNILQKFVPTNSYNNFVRIGHTFKVSYSDKKEYEDNKIDDTFITFNKDDKGQINNITLSHQWLIKYNGNDHSMTQDITKIKLENNKISQIEEYNCVDEQIVGTITTINNQDDIAQKIKQIFGNKNDIGMQNILAELDEEQLNAITNGGQIDINNDSSKFKQATKQTFNNNDIVIQNNLVKPDKEQPKDTANNNEFNISPKISSPDLDSNGYCPCNNCNCNLDCLNCFSGIFNSKN